MVSKVVRVACLVGLATTILFVLASTGCGDNYNDTTPPIITNVEVTDLSGTSATISWSTDEPSRSVVHYAGVYEHGTIGTLRQDKALVTGHSIKLEDLEANRTYNYTVVSKDRWGNQATSETFTFTTSS